MEQIYFSDNFFLLRNHIQVLQELLELEVNGNIFNSQIMEGVRHISQMLIKHEQLLNERNQLQNFSELAHQLFRIKQAFLRFLRSATYSQKKFLQILLQENSEEWHKIITKISDGNEKLAEEIHSHNRETGYDNAIVSDAELELLFQNDDLELKFDEN